MNEERWREVWEVFLAARELPAERQAHARSAVADPELRELLATLLADDDARDPNALFTPDTSSKDVTPPAEEWSLLGKTFGRFVITGPLGRGGMGEVYRGRDTELNRTVALKFLSCGGIGGNDAVNRVLREAQAASALNHPGIVTVYDVLRSDKTAGIVMELIEGVPLRSICGKPHPVAQVANWGRQIALALAAAHAAGIVHRDIKPENLILRPDDFVKVLDFGLARQIEGSVLQSTAQRFGGTLRYMSPEQVLGERPQAPSDVFTLGIVLYELVTGVYPFGSESPKDTGLGETQVATPSSPPGFDALLAPYAIATREPAAGSTLNPSIPPEFDTLLGEMLEKDPAKRPDAETAAARLLAIQHLPAHFKRRPRSRLPVLPGWRVAFVVASLAAALGAVLWMQRQQASRPSAPVVLQADPLTSAPGNEVNPAFSPDGRQIAYAWDGDSNTRARSIYVRLIDGGNPLRLTSGADDDNPVWSPDATKIAFLRYSSGGAQVVVVPALGGAERVVRTVVDARLTDRKLLAWSPDPDELIVADNPPEATQGLRLRLYGLRISSGQERSLTHPPSGTNDVEPVFSPDGQNLAFLRVRGDYYQFHLIHALGAPSRELATVKGVQGLTWSADSRSLVYSTNEPTPPKVSILPVDGGEPAPAPFQVDSTARALVVARRGGRVAFVHEQTDTNIWAKSSTDPAFRRLIASTRADEDPRISPDGRKIAFTSNRSGKYEIWVCDRNGSNPHAVTSQGSFAGSAAWSPDGRILAYDSAVSGTTEIWLVNADGGPSRRLLNPPVPGFVPNWSTGSPWVYFCVGGEIWKAPVSGGPPVQVTQRGGFEGFETFDGKYLYFVKGLTVRGIWRLPLAGGEEELLPELASVMPFRYWAMARDGIYYAESHPRPVLKLFRFQDRKTLVVTGLPNPPARAERGLSVSADGRLILYMQVDSTRHEIMVAQTTPQQ